MRNKIVEKFINSHLEAVKRNEDITGIPYLAALAQAALESGWGMHVKGGNFFGVKAGKTYKGEKQNIRTTEVENGKKKLIYDDFRVYSSFENSLNDYSDLILKRFPKALDHKDPVKFIESIQNDHGYKYATDPEYVNKIKSVIKTITGYLFPGMDGAAGKTAAVEKTAVPAVRIKVKDVPVKPVEEIKSDN